MKMKMKKIRALSFGLAVIVLLSIGGCGTQTETGKSDVSELTIFMYDAVAFKDDYPIYSEAEKMTGIHIKGIMSQSTTEPDSAFNLMMASGNLADIIYTNGRAKFAKYGREGAFIPLNDLIDKHAPNLKKVLDNNPDIKNFITAMDGNIYFIPFIPGGKASQGWFIRKDWLEKLKLEYPATLDEFYNVMREIRDNDLNGNGKQDEIPYFSKGGEGIYDLYSFWGMNGSFYVESGEVKFSPIEKNFKTATKTIANWYKEGLIDPEIYTRGSNSREYMFGNNLGGIIHDWFASTAGYNDKLSSSIPGFNLQPIAPPAGYDGKIREFQKRQSVSELGYAISSKNSHPEITMEWIDFWFSEKGNRLMNYGIEGEDYTMVDGKPKFTDKVLNNEKSVASYLKSRGGQGNVPFVQDFEYEKQWMNELALKGTELYVSNNYFTEQYIAPLMSDEDQEEYNSIMTNVNTLVDEKMQKWILGSEDVDSTYGEFIKAIKNMGVDRAIELVNKNYK